MLKITLNVLNLPKKKEKMIMEVVSLAVCLMNQKIMDKEKVDNQIKIWEECSFKWPSIN